MYTRPCLISHFVYMSVFSLISGSGSCVRLTQERTKNMEWTAVHMVIFLVNVMLHVFEMSSLAHRDGHNGRWKAKMIPRALHWQGLS